MLETVWYDLRYAGRLLRQTPVFTAVAAASLAVGIAGSATVFSIVDALFLRAAPGVEEPERLVEVGRVFRGQRFGSLSYPDFVDFRDRNRVFDGLAAYQHTSRSFGLSTGDVVDRVDGIGVSDNYFTVLGARMLLGRGFRPDEDGVGSPAAVMVITHRLWQRHFNSDSNVVGRVVRLNERPFTIVGVAPPGFAGHTIATTDLWVPLAAMSLTNGNSGQSGDNRAPFSLRGAVWLSWMGRLKPGVSMAQARGDMNRIAADLAREYPDDDRGAGVALAPLRAVPAQVAPIAAGFLGLLFALVGLVLLIAGTNVAGMMLTRGVTRARDVAVRVALGASRHRIMRLLLAESLLLALAGSAIGVAFSYGLVGLVRAMMPVLPIAVALDVRVDLPVVLFSVALSLGVGLLFGVMPARESSRTDLSSATKPEHLAGLPRLRLQHAFVVAQVAMSMLLIVVAMLLSRSLLNAAAIDPGFDIRHLEAVTVDPGLAAYPSAQRQQFANELLTRVSRIPGVDGAALSQMIPLSTESLALGGLRASEGSTERGAFVFPDWDPVSPTYFTTMAIPIVRGRAFTDQDRADTQAVVIVNETVARRLWPGEDPIGRMVLHREGPRQRERALLVVGVARDSKYSTLGEEAQPYAYIPITQRPPLVADAALSVLVRTRRGSVLQAVRAVAHDMDPNLPIIRSGRLTDLAAFSLLPHRAATWLSASVGIIGLLLAALGLYGVTTYNAARRTREIGIRIAVGAVRSEVMRMVVSRAVMLAGTGAGIGVALAAGAARLLAAFLYGVGPLDAVSFGAGLLLLTFVTAAASVVPARRAASIDPVAALRAE